MVIRLSTFLSSLSRFFISSQSLLICRLVRRVNLITLTGRKEIPIRQHLANEIVFCFITLGSSGKISNLTFNAITVSTKHPTDVTRFVIVV